MKPSGFSASAVAFAGFLFAMPFHLLWSGRFSMTCRALLTTEISARLV